MVVVEGTFAIILMLPNCVEIQQIYNHINM
jgi:hypothetical protein